MSNCFRIPGAEGHLMILDGEICPVVSDLIVPFSAVLLVTEATDGAKAHLGLNPGVQWWIINLYDLKAVVTRNLPPEDLGFTHK